MLLPENISRGKLDTKSSSSGDGWVEVRATANLRVGWPRAGQEVRAYTVTWEPEVRVYLAVEGTRSEGL